MLCNRLAGAGRTKAGYEQDGKYFATEFLKLTKPDWWSLNSRQTNIESLVVAGAAHKVPV